ncbi:thioredoxin family protein [Oxalobacteraceae bacterium R-40]|uniref:Thioredoxin family protein n=1 Tax=Keguizhuia sedimenti TaxID=3064264 RepID=A0ABU1BQL1_9BURK|nr:thioredoxin family protein [Oxalobacteraceae bacterium R-40]
MPFYTLDSTNRNEISSILSEDKWVMACLCAAWCDVCRQYRAGFEQLANEHPDKYFIWIDIEDQADVVGDFDVENFPTLLIQRADTVAFFGTVLPEIRQANRLLLAQTEKTRDELLREVNSSAEKKEWQSECNLRQRLVVPTGD